MSGNTNKTKMICLSVYCQSIRFKNTPVSPCTTKLENARVGQKRYFLTINNLMVWADGSISPEEAVRSWQLRNNDRN